MALIDLRARAWGRIEALRRAKAHMPGQHDQSSHAHGGAGKGSYGGEVMSSDEYDSMYEVHDESAFGDDGGQVRSMTNGDLQIAFERGDGSVEVFADLTPSGAQEIADGLDWANGVDADAAGDRGPDPRTGLLDWKKTEDGLLIGPDTSGDVSVVGREDPSNVRMDFSGRDAIALSVALGRQIDAAAEAIADA